MEQFLRDAVEARLRMVIPYIEKWPQVQNEYKDCMCVLLKRPVAFNMVSTRIGQGCK